VSAPCELGQLCSYPAAVSVGEHARLH